MADSNINQESGEAVTSQDVKYEITPAGEEIQFNSYCRSKMVRISRT